jgi:hypothetical protein
VGGRGGFYYVNDANELFLYHRGNIVGPASLDSLYRQEFGGTASTAARRRLRQAVQDAAALTIVSCDTDAVTLWLVLGSGWVVLPR